MLIDLVDWVTHLQATVTHEVRLVTDVKAAETESVAYPAQFVCHSIDRVSHAGGHPMNRHTISSDILVVTAINRGNQTFDKPLRDELRMLRQPVIDALVGWEPVACGSPVVFSGGKLLSVKDYAMFWVDVFTIDYLLTKN